MTSRQTRPRRGLLSLRKNRDHLLDTKGTVYGIMKKDENNAEDILAQLSNSKTKENVALSLYTKLPSTSLSNVQRCRALKLIIAHCNKSGTSADFQDAALSMGLNIIKTEFKASKNAATGIYFNFVEHCWKIVSGNALNEKKHSIKTVSRALEVLSVLNSATVTKLFQKENGISFKNTIIVCLNTSDLEANTLMLMDLVLSASTSEEFCKTLLDSRIELVAAIYPLLFVLGKDEVRCAALSLLKKLPLTSRPEEFWSKLKDDTQKVYSKNLIEMVAEKQQWPPVWQFVVNMFGDELRSGGQLINNMLEVLERAFKHPDLEWTRIQAFVCWNTLIDNFKNGFKNKKRIDLIMIPMKANNHRIESLALAKLGTYVHFFKVLGKELITHSELLLHFFTFCFGSEKSNISPVRSYPSLHKNCALAMKELIASFNDEIFLKIYKDFIPAVGHCFLLEDTPSDLLREIWLLLLDLVRKNIGSEVVKSVFSMINSTVTQAAKGEASSSYVLRSVNSPLKSASGEQQLDRDLAKKIVVIMLNEMVHGNFALGDSIFKSRALYIGSYDVMAGTPAMLILEWIATPALMLGAGDTKECRQLISKMICLRQEESSGFMDFSQLLLKKMPISEDTLPLDKKLILLEHTTFFWCCLAKSTVEYIHNGGDVNQGHAAEHDFGALYSLLVFPAQYLYSDFKLIERCCKPWGVLFYEAYMQAELVPTSRGREFCEQVCLRLAGVSGRHKSSRQLASVYYFLACVLKVATEKFKSNKNCMFIQQCVSGLLKELDAVSVDQELVLNQVVACVQNCLEPHPGSEDVLQNISVVVCSLLRSKIDSPDGVDRLCTILSTLKKAMLLIWHQESSKKYVDVVLQNLKKSGCSHSSRKVVAAVEELGKAWETLEKDDKSLKLFLGNSMANPALSPSNHVSVSSLKSVKTSPKPNILKQTSPGKAKARLNLQIASPSTNDQFVHINTPPKKIHLTEHQKEVRRQKREIPALYQDLSQDTQSMSQDSSQDFVALPPTPNAKSFGVLDEEAVADFVDIETLIKASKVETFKPLKSSGKSSHPSPPSKNDASGFRPPAGFSLPSSVSESENDNSIRECAVTEYEQDIGSDKQTESVVTSAKEVKLKESHSKGAKTRISANASIVNSSSTTRSGKVLTRLSLAPPGAEPLKKRKYVRKSLPGSSSEGLLKKSIETIVIESDTDTESISSIASDLSVSGTESTKVSRRRGRSKKGSSKEMEVAGDSSVGLSDVSKSVTKAKDVSCLDVLNIIDCNGIPQNPELSLKKLVGGKVLTRSRSNSSLSDIFESDAKKNHTLICEGESQSVKRDSFEGVTIAGTEVKSKIQSIEDLPGTPVSGKSSPALIHSQERPIKEAGDICISPKKITSSSVSSVGKTIAKEMREGVLGTHNVPKKNDDDERECTGKNSSQTKDGTCSFERGSEESQEIIESSQPIMNRIRPCAVSLGPNIDTAPNKSVEIDDVVIVKGPDASSPFKVHCKDTNIDTSNARNSACRSLMHEDKLESPSIEICLKLSDAGTPLSQRNQGGSPEKLMISTEGNSKENNKDSPKKVCNGDINDLKENGGDDKMENSVQSCDQISQINDDCRPEWMHEKKISPPNKSLRPFRSASSRSHACMRSLTDGDFASSPPKGGDVSPMSSPVQSKKIIKPNLEPASTSTPITQRSSRAAQLLGLGQAAAARGGETVVASSPRSVRSEASEVSSNVGSSSVNFSTTNSNTQISTPATVVASPLVRRSGRVLELGSQSKSLEDDGIKGDWVPSDPCPQSTPDSSILKRKRDNDGDVPSPNVKRKRVSFRDPPLFSLLRYDCESSSSKGVLFSSDRSRDPETLGLENQSEGCDKNKSNFDPMEETQEGANVKKAGAISKFTHEDSKVESDSLCKPQNKCEGTRGEPKDSEEIITLWDSDIPLMQRDNERSMQNDASKIGIENTTKGDDETGKTRKRKRSSFDEVSSRKSLNLLLEKNETESGLHSPPKEALTPDKIWSIKRKPSEKVHVMEENGENEGVSGHEISIEEDMGTQGQLDDLHRMSSLSSPVYPSLMSCTHPVQSIVSKLTTPVWEKALLDEFTKKEIFTIGDVARLTEDKVDRLSVKHPKRRNVCDVLSHFENRHSVLEDRMKCRLSGDSSSENVLAGLIDKLQAELKKQSDNNVASSLLCSLPIDLIADSYISRVSLSSGASEKNITDENLSTILKKVPPKVLENTICPTKSSDLSSSLTRSMLEYIARECGPSEILLQWKDAKLLNLINLFISKLDPSDVLQHFEGVRSDQLIEAFLSSTILMEKFFSKMILVGIPKQLDQCTSEKLIKAFLLHIGKPSETLVEALSSVMTPMHVARKLTQHQLEVAQHLDHTESDEVLNTLLSCIKKPSENIMDKVSSLMTPKHIVKELTKHQNDVLKELDHKESEEMAISLLGCIEKPSEHLVEKLSSLMSPEHIAKELTKHQVEVVKHLDQKESEDVASSLLAGINKPSEKLRGTLSSLMSPVDVARKLVEHPDDIAKQLNQRDLEEVTSTLLGYIKKPTEKFIGKLSECMTPLDVSKKLTQNHTEVIQHLDQRKSEELIKDLLSRNPKPSLQLIEVLSSFMNRSDIASNINLTSTEMLITTLLSNISGPSEQITDAFLSKVKPLDLVLSDNFNIAETLKAVDRKVVYRLLSSYLSDLADS